MIGVSLRKSLSMFSFFFLYAKFIKPHAIKSCLFKISYLPLLFFFLFNSLLFAVAISIIDLVCETFYVLR